VSQLASSTHAQTRHARGRLNYGQMRQQGPEAAQKASARSTGFTEGGCDGSEGAGDTPGSKAETHKGEGLVDSREVGENGTKHAVPTHKRASNHPLRRLLDIERTSNAKARHNGRVEGACGVDCGTCCGINAPLARRCRSAAVLVHLRQAVDTVLGQHAVHQATIHVVQQVYVDENAHEDPG